LDAFQSSGEGRTFAKSSLAVWRLCRSDNDGSACNQNGLRGRISQYFSPGPTQITNKRILALVAEADHYEIGWCAVAAKSRAVGLEQELLERYFTDHGKDHRKTSRGDATIRSVWAVSHVRTICTMVDERDYDDILMLFESKRHVLQ
jgi:hypothetical protein